MLILTVILAALAAPLQGADYAAHGDSRLKDLIEESLNANPAVLRAVALSRAARQRVPQAAALPDPTLSATTFARSIETRAGPQRAALSITQRIPGLGKRTAGAQLAAKSAELQGELYRTQRAETVRRVKHAYYDLGYVDAALAANREDEALLGHFEEIARLRYARGAGQQGDALRLQAGITRAIHARLELEGERIVLEAALNLLRAAPADTPLPEVRLGRFPEIRLDAAVLARIGRRSGPEVRAALARVEESEKRLHIARINRRPDLSVGLAWGNIRAHRSLASEVRLPIDGKDSYAVSVGMTLPIFRRKYDAGIREAAAALTASRHAHADSNLRTESEVRAGTFWIETIRRQMDLYERTLVPQAEQALETTLASYSNGTVEGTALLEVRRMLLEVRVSLARLRTDGLKALADLERILGAALPEGDAS